MWAASREDLYDSAITHYGYKTEEAVKQLEAMQSIVQTCWRDFLAFEGMPEEAIERYRGTFSELP